MVVPFLTSPDAAFQVVAFISRPHLTKLNIELAREIKNNHASKVIMYCSTEQERTFYAKHGVFDDIILHDKMLYETDDSQIDEKDVLARAHRIESDYGITINQLAMTNRHLGRGFALGGYFLPRSKISESVTHIGMIHRLVVQMEFWEQQIAQHGISLCLHAPYMLDLVLNKHNIPMRCLCFARVEDRYFWAYDGFDLTPLLPLAYDSLEGVELEPPTPVPSKTYVDFLRQTLAARSFLVLIKDLGFITARHVYWRLKGYAKANGYLVTERLRDRIRQWRDIRRVTGKEMLPLSAMENKPFVFYPLHTEPEQALQTLSPLHFYQLSAIAGIARDLPAGITLAVKEHVLSIGRRPTVFYDQIMEFKNAVMLNMAEPGVEITSKALAVVTITSTAGLEAALRGKPVVTFGRNNIYNILPHVKVITDEADLQGALAWATDPNFDHDSAVRCGARFAEAMKMISMKLDGYSEFHPNSTPQDAAVESYKHLYETLTPKPYGLG